MEPPAHKTIAIDPNLFSKTANTRRKRNAGAPKEKKQPTNALKKSIIKMIRKHQQDKIKQEIKQQLATNASASTMQGGGNIEGKTGGEDEAVVENINRLLSLLPDTEDGDENTEFADSMQFLEKLSESVKKGGEQQPPKIQFHPTTTPVNVPYNSAENNAPLSMVGGGPTIPFAQQPMVQQPMVQQPSMIPVHKTTFISPQNHPNTAPIYGVLRQGNLPTYRDWSGKTLRHTQSKPKPVYPMSEEQRNRMNWLEAQIKKASIERQIDQVNRLYREIDSKTGNPNKQVIGGNQLPAKYSGDKKDPRPQFMHIPKQRRIVKRTYRVGKKVKQNKLGVLLPNKTIRAQVSLTQQQARQAPMPEVRKYLIRHGFIEIGSTAPANVLRHMYETAKSFTGEIVNHSADELVAKGR